MAQKQQEKQQEKQEQPQQTHQPRWLLLAIASGTFAAMNGVFAKLYVYMTTNVYQLLMIK